MELHLYENHPTSIVYFNQGCVIIFKSDQEFREDTATIYYVFIWNLLVYLNIEIKVKNYCSQYLLQKRFFIKGL